MKPFFSIIIPTYNRAQVIDRTIRSVLSQTYTEWELIVVDDGSTDDTSVQMAKYNDPRIFYYQKEHAERSAARNYGLERASGKYICFLDSDDEYLPSFLSLNYEAITANPNYKVFRIGTYLVKDNERIALPFPDPSWSALEAICKNFNSPGSYCFGREVIGEIRFDERFNIAEDFHFLMRLFNQYQSIYFINKYEYSYNYNPKSELINDESLIKMKLKIEVFYDLLQIYTWPIIVIDQLRSRIIIVDFLIINLFFRKLSLKFLPGAIVSFYHLLRYPLLTIKTILTIKK